MLGFWQHLPLILDPIVFSVGFFSLRWYALFFLMGFGAAALFVWQRSKQEGAWLSTEEMFDLASSVFFGALVGARLGYALFYQPAYFLAHPLALIVPYDTQMHLWIGIAGLSFHGGLVGVGVAVYGFAWKKHKAFWRLADLLALAAPLGLFFGRLGNFFNNELPGRMTTKPWGMFFPEGGDRVLYHPSTLYAALLEGVVLFACLWCMRQRFSFPGALASLFMMLYALLRFGGEFLRAPDPGVALWSGMSRGQALSLVLLFFGGCLFFWLKKQKNGKIVQSA